MGLRSGASFSLVACSFLLADSSALYDCSTQRLQMLVVSSSDETRFFTSFLGRLQKSHLAMVLFLSLFAMVLHYTGGGGYLCSKRMNFSRGAGRAFPRTNARNDSAKFSSQLVRPYSEAKTPFS